MNKNNRPYTTAELLEMLEKAHGIKPRHNYIYVVIFNKKRSTPHPLAAAKLGRGMWDRATVDKYFSSTNVHP